MEELTEFNKSLVKEILNASDGAAWDQKTRELKFRWVEETFVNMREFVWQYYIWAPVFVFVMNFIREELPEIAKKTEWEECELEPGQKVLVPSDDWLLDEIQFRIDVMLHPLWHDSEFRYQELTPEIVMDLGIVPTVIPPRVNKHGEVQPALF